MPFFNPFGNGEVSEEKDKDFSCYIPMASLNRGTYRELKAILNELPDDMLDDRIVISDDDEYKRVMSLGFTGPASELGDGHMYLSI